LRLVLAVGIQHAMLMHHIVICIFPHHLTKALFEKNIMDYDMCFDFLYKFYLKYFSFYEDLSEIRSKMCVGLQVNNRFCFKIFNKLEYSRHIL